MIPLRFLCCCCLINQCWKGAREAAGFVSGTAASWSLCPLPVFLHSRENQRGKPSIFLVICVSSDSLFSSCVHSFSLSCERAHTHPTCIQNQLSSPVLLQRSLLKPNSAFYSKTQAVSVACGILSHVSLQRKGCKGQLQLSRPVSSHAAITAP